MKLKMFACGLLTGLAMTLSACVSSPKPSASASPVSPTLTAAPEVCSRWKVITFDRNADTVPTIEQVKASNAARDAYCTP